MMRGVYSFFFGSAVYKADRALKAMADHKSKGRTRRMRVIENALQRRYGVYVSSAAEIGKGLSLPHPVGIVIGAGCKIGDRVRIYQNVTLGAASRADGAGARYPEIGDDTTIFAGAVLIGGIRVGRGCVIGANSVVLSDVPDGATAVGVPAKILIHNKKLC